MQTDQIQQNDQTEVGNSDFPQIFLRRATPSDCAEIQAIASDSEAANGLGCPALAGPDWWRHRIERHGNNGIFVLAEHETRPVAFIEIFVDITDWARRSVGVCMLCVHRDFRGQGVGRALLEQGVAWAERSLGLARLELNVWADHWPAINLYKSVGFIQEGLHPAFGFRDGAHTTALTMGKLLIST